MPGSFAGGATESAILTGGLRRILFGAILVAATLAAAQIAAVARLQTHIGQWAWIAEINALREDLLARTRESLSDLDGVPAEAVLAGFAELDKTILARDGSGLTDGIAAELSASEKRARALYTVARERQDALAPHLAHIQSATSALQGINGTWARQILDREREMLRRSEELEARNRYISELKSALLSAVFAAQSLQQQIVAIGRLREGAPPEVLSSMIAGLDASALPQPCAADATETAQRLCSPRTSRVHVALEALRAAEPPDIDAAVRGTLWALEGYARAGQARIATLSAEQSRTLDAAGNVRSAIAQLRGLTGSVTRINRTILDIERESSGQIETLADLERAERRMFSLSSQLRARMVGFLRIESSFGGDPRQIEELVSEVGSEWDMARVIIRERIQFQTEFASVMNGLSADIARHSDEIRRNTTLWVGIYATTFLVLALLLGAGVLCLVWLARVRFVMPLSRVTSTLIGLSRGDLGDPVTLKERAFGFDRLGAALEQLRLEMVERHALSVQTQKQQRIIESNLAELERTSEEMEWLAMHDTLTGLGNRRNADMELEAMTEAARGTQQDFCIMQIDVDRFKEINDALGHAAGDHVLRTVAEILKATCGPAAKCFRIGGDEFLVIGTACATSEQAAQIARKLIERIDAPIAYDDHLCRVGASIGIAFGRDAAYDATIAVMNADLALYDVKRSGRDGFRFFSDELASLSRRRKDISDRILAAIDDRAFTPFYQPQFYAENLSLRGVEVLCRWHDAQHGWISPGEFLTVADDLGVVGKIDEILFEKVADDLLILREAGLSLPRVSFNVTLDRLLKADLAKRLSEKIGDEVQIALELLESMSLDNPTESVSWAIDTLKENGIEIEIDDFGSYRASLAGLMAVNPRAMKIDRAIVMPIIESPRHLNLVKKIIDIGTALGIEVVAEGVETDDHVHQLTALGCDVLQGFGLGKPMPFEDLIALCRQQSGDGARGTAVA